MFPPTPQDDNTNPTNPPLRHRTNPSFKIFSPADMHNAPNSPQWGDGSGMQQQQGAGSFYNSGPQQPHDPYAQQRHNGTAPPRRKFSRNSQKGKIAKWVCLALLGVLILGGLGVWVYMKFSGNGSSDIAGAAPAAIERLNRQWQERQDRAREQEVTMGGMQDEEMKRHDADLQRDTDSQREEVRREREKLHEATKPKVHVEKPRNKVPPAHTEAPSPPPVQHVDERGREKEERKREQQQRFTDEEPAEHAASHDAPVPPTPTTNTASTPQQQPQHTDTQHQPPPQHDSTDPNEIVTMDDDDMPLLPDDETLPADTHASPDTAAQEIPPLHFHPEKPVNISYNEYHQQALHHVLENVLHAPNHYRPKGMTLVHFSSHYDLEVPFILHGSYLRSWKKFSSHVSTRAYLMPLVYLGLVKRIVWVRPSWAKTSLHDHHIYKFNIGNVGDSDRLAIDNMELVKAGLLFSGYAHKSKMEHAKEGELVVIEGDFAVEQVTQHPDALISNIMGITAQSDIIFNLDDSYFSAQNPLLNWLNSEESIHHKDFNIHAAINIFNPESYCVEQEQNDQRREEFANAFRAFYRTSERSELSEAAFVRLTEAIKPFWCNSQKLDYAMHNFKLVIHTVLHDEELSRDPELENIVQRLKELNVYPHHVSSEKQKDVLLSNLETLMGMILSKIHKAPFSTSVVLSLRDHLVPDTDKNVIMNRVHHMMRRLFGRVKLIKGFDRQVYSFHISPDEMRLTVDEDRHTMAAYDPETRIAEKKKRSKEKKREKRDSRMEKLRRQRAEIERELHEEAKRRAASKGRPRHQDHNDDRPQYNTRRGENQLGDDYYPMPDDLTHDNYESLEQDYEFDPHEHEHDDFHPYDRRS